MQNLLVKTTFLLVAISGLLLAGCGSGTSNQAREKTEQAAKNYFCKGNEPFWMVQIEPEKIVFKTPEEEITYPAVAAQKVGKDFVFETSQINAEGEQMTLKVRIMPKPCEDSMAGDAYPYTVRVEHNGQIYEGCGQ